jgi:hypothetical protein
VPAAISPLIGFVLGIAFAWASADELARASGSEPVGRPLVVASLFSLLVFAPASAYFLAFAPDWSYAYVVDSDRLPGAVDLAVILLDVASVPFGFALASRRTRDKELGPLLRLAAVPCLGAVTFVIVTLPQLSVHATYAQYHGDFGTRPVAGSPLGYALLWMNTVLLAAAVYTARALRRLKRPTRRR